MKNLIVVLALFFALGMNAQTKTAPKKEATAVTITPQATAKSNVNLVNTVFPIDKKTQASLQEILTSKYEILYKNPDLSTERKTALSESISSQIETVLGKETFAKIKRDQALYEILVN